MSEELSKEQMDVIFTTEELMKTITPERYIELASNTDMDTSEYDEQRGRISNLELVEELVMVLEKIVSSCGELDAIKKHVFYGKALNMTRVSGHTPSTSTHRASGMLNNNKMTHLAHGIIGKATESGELCEALLKHLRDGEKFDEVNIIEEIGDGQWYDALLLRVLNVSFAKVWSINIAKLYKRFGGKFSKEKALVRNLKVERKILEG